MVKLDSEDLFFCFSLVLLNGVPRKNFHCRRGGGGVRPLSPPLFVVGADLLQSLINIAHHLCLLSKPLPYSQDHNFPVV